MNLHPERSVKPSFSQSWYEDFCLYLEGKLLPYQRCPSAKKRHPEGCLLKTQVS